MRKNSGAYNWFKVPDSILIPNILTIIPSKLRNKANMNPRALFLVVSVKICQI